MSQAEQEIIYSLEMLSPTQHKKKLSQDPSFTVSELIPTDPSVNKYFYLEVGKDWLWTERRVWTTEQWSDYVHSNSVHTFVARSGDVQLGYFELLPQADNTVELVYFGLLESAVGKGFGSAMLSKAIDEAWKIIGDASKGRVWVHTCNFDHPNALGNYQRLGFSLYNIEKVEGETL
jgi:GNAT superfamily N-acetyltransferase